jgi:nucleoside-diphosphate-sugar epimerase
VLVTGASGFIGRHCLAALQARGYEIHATTAGAPPAQNEVHWHQVDLLDDDATTALLAQLQADSLLHLAWYAKHGLFWQALENIDWVRASLSLLRAFIAHGGRRMVCAGSCAEYDWNNGICSEDRTPLRPQGLYGTAKNAFHAIAAEAARRANVSLAWGRIFFLYGAGEQDARLVPLIINAQLRGERVALTGGDLQRDYLHVSDVAAALVALLDSGVEGAVNIGSGQAVAIRAIAERLTASLGRPELVEFAAGDAIGKSIPLVVADTKRLTDELHWQPTVDLDRGLDLSIDWWRQRSERSR